MRCAVTGGAGFIGSHLVRELLSAGHQVTVIDLKEGDIPGVKYEQGRIEDLGFLQKAIHGQDFIFHLAAMASVPESVKDPHRCNLVNATGTLYVLLASKGVKRVIFSSSAAIYGNAKKLPVREDLPFSPESPYASSKIAGEIYCRAFSRLGYADTVCLRYFNVYGPGQAYSPYAGVITHFANRMDKGERPVIFGTGTQTRDFINVKDVVRANILAMEKGPFQGEAINIASGREITINELYRQVAKIKGFDEEPIYEQARPGDVNASFADVRKAKELLGFETTVKLSEGLTL
jgi:nucleoside-diphosphate-sugar epimerase